ncbi:hypothetical protein BD779DRAFT_1805353 [Infundibulicybe gibba]|nr:hypothetical protein BD779DRAFT_1805353 [Infundibulicybe gibba]
MASCKITYNSIYQSSHSAGVAWPGGGNDRHQTNAHPLSMTWAASEEGTMQVLRAISEMYVPVHAYISTNSTQIGTSPFLIARSRKKLQVLHHRTLHAALHPVCALPLIVVSVTADAPKRNPFLFTDKHNTLDQDQIAVPAG